MVTGLDGKVALDLGNRPLPLLEADFQALQGELGYDAVGRGIYQALRTDPDCLHCESYAALLKEGYPHYVSELASHIIMLGEKDVEVPYLDRRVKLLKIFALMEPQDPHFPLEIGATLLEKGCRFSALHLSTVTLYKAEGYLDQALALAPGDAQAASTLAEVAFLLGKYDKAAALWRRLLPNVPESSAAEISARLERIEKGELPMKEEGGYLEAAAILNDVMADAFFSCEFPMAEIPYLLALCCKDLGSYADARTHLRRALRMNPDFVEAQAVLTELEQQIGAKA